MNYPYNLSKMLFFGQNPKPQDPIPSPAKPGALALTPNSRIEGKLVTQRICSSRILHRTSYKIFEGLKIVVRFLVPKAKPPHSAIKKP